MRLKLKLWLAVVLLAQMLKAQGRPEVMRWVNHLSAPAMHGRGYVMGGLDTAAGYLISELRAMGLKPAIQSFSMPVNTFPGRMALTVNGRRLRPGLDFLADAGSTSFAGRCRVFHRDHPVPHWVGCNGSLVLMPKRKLTWTVSPSRHGYTMLEVDSALLTGKVVEVKAAIDAVFSDSFPAKNIFCMVPGTRRSDSLLVFTAHYDHLGRMGRAVYFPGANDNASGTALLLALAGRIHARPLPYTSLFVFFAGEEAGLLGSEFFVNHAPVQLDKIRFLLNLDLMGTGEEGITVVNATEYPDAFQLLLQLNRAKGYFPVINSRGKARNSDHYWFTEKGVPAFFWYTLGGRKAYHDIHDSAATLQMPALESLLELIPLFIEQIAGMPLKPG